jgi:hypothetical protein
MTTLEKTNAIEPMHATIVGHRMIGPKTVSRDGGGFFSR